MGRKAVAFIEGEKEVKKNIVQYRLQVEAPSLLL